MLKLDHFWSFGRNTGCFLFWLSRGKTWGWHCLDSDYEQPYNDMENWKIITKGYFRLNHGTLAFELTTTRYKNWTYIPVFFCFPKPIRDLIGWIIEMRDRRKWRIRCRQRYREKFRMLIDLIFNRADILLSKEVLINPYRYNIKGDRI